MERPHKIPLSLSDSEYSRLKQLQTSFQKTSKKHVSMSDILRRALFSMPFQVSLFSALSFSPVSGHLLTGSDAPAADRSEVVSTGYSITRTESHFWDYCQISTLLIGGEI